MAQKQGYSRLRTHRLSIAGAVYMITIITNNRQRVFDTWHAGRPVIAALRRAETEQHAKTLAWVLMPDHLHWLLVLGDTSLGTLVRRMKGRATAALRARGLNHNFWQNGYHDTLLKAPADIYRTARYIIANPLRAGLVSRVGDYPLWDAKYWLDGDSDFI